MRAPHGTRQNAAKMLVSLPKASLEECALPAAVQVTTSNMHFAEMFLMQHSTGRTARKYACKFVH